ncbi:hypothetical protein NE237_004630 [Protea cynaroides]|uniref:Uncharacterized protein n=1 Tax=Protea cynaroides TaxID=273540 RepID=A0A9Q0KJ99_9MAGN|nr:hypothetical protein NE237_004630 [Protea cynaroides]
MVPFLLLLEGVALFSVWSDIREIDAQPAMSDNGAEVVNLSAPQQWHTTLDLTAGPVTFRNGGSPLATTTRVVVDQLPGPPPWLPPSPLPTPPPPSPPPGTRPPGKKTTQTTPQKGAPLLLLHRGAVRSQKQGMS